MPIHPAQLEGVSLGRIALTANAEFAAEDTSKTTYDVTPSFTIGELQTDAEGGLRAHVTLRASILFSRIDEQPEGPTPFEIEIDVHAAFHWAAEEAPPAELARGWLEYNAMYLVWPYLRGYVGAITGMTHLPPLTIFTMNVPKAPVIPARDESTETHDEEAAGEEASPAPPPVSQG